MSRERLQSPPQSRQCGKCRARSELEGAVKYMTDKECGPPRETRGADLPPPPTHTHTPTLKFISFGGEGTIRSRSAVPNLSPPDTALMCALPPNPPPRWPLPGGPSLSALRPSSVPLNHSHFHLAVAPNGFLPAETASGSTNAGGVKAPRDDN